jgi:hypothetical protein
MARFQRSRAREYNIQPNHPVVGSDPRLVHRARHQHHCPDRVTVAQHVDRHQSQPGLLDLRAGLGALLLDASWFLSANFRYDINTASRGVTMGAPVLPGSAANGFVSGNELFGDFTGLYRIGKWQFGPVGYFEAQTTADKPGGGVPCTPAICGYQSQIALGALVGYDFPSHSRLGSTTLSSVRTRSAD